ncbi:MAG: hypothetical protein ACTSYC_05965 [Promethearchaeota archaeon]
MSEEPQLPPLPDIGVDAIGRKKRFSERIKTVVKCGSCYENYTRDFIKGDYTFKRLTGEKCPKCNASQSLTITEIFSEWIDPKKEKKKK